jgi:hypothetical protein
MGDPELVAIEHTARKTLEEGALDLGLQPLWLAPSTGAALDEAALLAHASQGWSAAFELQRAEHGIEVRLIAVAPKQSLLRVRRETATQDNLEVVLLRLLRDVARPTASLDGQCGCQTNSQDGADSELGQPAPRDLDGRAYLAVTGAMVGGYTGYALEHIAGSGNPRIIYPLMTVGAGVGVAASLVAADEWHVSMGEAWYLSAATLWSTASALLISDGVKLSDPSHRHAYGLLGTATGLSLGTLAVATSDIGQGSALVTQSGAIFGGLLGGVGERLVNTDLTKPPTLGLGLGLGIGALGAGFAATRLPSPDPSRVVYIDLAAFLGALTGAAVASPAIVGRTVTQTETRLWLGSVLLGTLIGGGLGYAITSDDSEHDPRDQRSATRPLPYNLQLAVAPIQPLATRGPAPWTWGVQGTW